MQRLRKNESFWFPVQIFGALAVLVGVFIGGVEYGRTFSASAASEEIPGVGRLPREAPEDMDFATFWEVWQLVSERYVDQPVSQRDLYYGALQGLVYGLGDPYSTYFTPEEAEAFNRDLDGSFFGIGAEIGLNADGDLVVVAPLDGTPAARAGILASDRILAIDGVDTAGMTVNEAVDMIRGERGTVVTLTLWRGAGEPFDVAITRDEIRVDSVTWEMRSDGIAVIEVSMFNEDTVPLFEQAVADITAQGAEGLILDLRNNPGGYLDGAIQLAGFWINGQTAVIEEIRGEQTPFAAVGPNTLNRLPTVALVNGGSASAAEILAGALRDYGLATLVGEQTFGKGSVQEYQELPDGGALKITIARWLTPKGVSIDENGITPDVAVPYTAEDYHAQLDPQFDEAVRLLTSP